MEHSIKLNELNEFISCPICHGYLIEATTVSECLHTFCRSCIVRHIKNDHNDCPKCKTVIHERRPLDYILHDRNKQDIVYKLVPQLYISELNKRLAARETRDIDNVTKFVLENEILNVILINRRYRNSEEYIIKATEVEESKPIYLRCPLTIQVRHIKKLLIAKFQLSYHDRLTLMYKGDIIEDCDQVSNLAQSLTFCLHYEISRISLGIKQENKDKTTMEIDTAIE